MSQMSIRQALEKVRWYSPQEIEEARMNRIIDEKIERNQAVMKRTRPIEPELLKIKQHDNY